jgi:hypothetical protein
MPIQGRVHVLYRATVSSGNGVDTPVDEFIVVHSATLPLPPCFAYSNAPLEIARHCLQMANQLGFLGVYHRDQLLVIGTAAARPDAGRQGRERSRIAIAEPTPQPLHAAHTRRLPPQVANCMPKTVTLPASDRVSQVHVTATLTATRALEPWPANARHRLVPNNGDGSFVDPNTGRTAGKLALLFAPLEPCRCPFDESSTLQQLPDIDARVGFSDQVVGNTGVVIVAE